jgi:hypothetical protein
MFRLNLITWRSKKQPCITFFFTRVEDVAMLSVAKKTWFSKLLGDIQGRINPRPNHVQILTRPLS